MAGFACCDTDDDEHNEQENEHDYTTYAYVLCPFCG